MESELTLKVLLQALITFGTIVSSLVLPGLWSATVYGHRTEDEAAREAGGEASPFGGPGAVDENWRIGIVVAFPLVMLFFLLVIRGTLQIEWMGEFLLLTHGLVYCWAGYRFFWSSLDLPEEGEDPRLRARVVLWYRRRMGWMVAGMSGILLVEFFFSTPTLSFVAVHMSFTTLVYYWSILYFLETALPPRSDSLYQQREADRAGRAEMFPARMAMLLFILALMTPWTIGQSRVFIPMPGAQWICYVILGWWLVYRAGVQSRKISENFGGRRLNATRRTLDLVHTLVGLDNEMTAKMEHEEKLAWRPQVRYRQAPQEGGGAWDMLWEGLGIWAATLLPILALVPHVQLFGLPVFWLAAGCAVGVIAFPLGGGHVKPWLIALVSGTLLISGWLGPGLVPWLPVFSCILLLGMRWYLDGTRAHVPMVAAGREGRWWIARVPRRLSRPSAIPHPVWELPGTGWQPLGKDDLVPWSSLWQPPEAEWGRLRWQANPGVLVLAVAVLLSMACLELSPHLEAGVILTHESGWTVGRLLKAGDLAAAEEQLTRAKATGEGLAAVKLLEAQFLHDEGARREEVIESLRGALELYRGWLPGRAARLLVGLEREAALKLDASRWEPEDAWAEKPHVIRQIYLARSMEGVDPGSLGYDSPKALSRQIWMLADRAVREIPSAQQLRDYWWGRTQLLLNEEALLRTRMHKETRVSVSQTLLEEVLQDG